MNDAGFYERRKEQIDNKLEMIAKLETAQLKAFFESEYERHKNKHNPIVNWDNQKLTK
jgi:Fanconi-associated nuclease 1